MAEAVQASAASEAHIKRVDRVELDVNTQLLSAELEDQNGISLFTILVWNDEQTSITFSSAVGRSVSLLIEDAQPDSDTALYDTTYFYLPDVDADGLPELLVRSTVSQLWTMKERSGAFDWEMVRSYYRGP